MNDYVTRVEETATTTTIEIQCIPAKQYVATVVGGPLNYWDGSAWVQFAASATATGFQFFTPPSGRIQVVHPATYSLQTANH